jgi:Spy/CpxP family protein refolding chaperone
MQTTRPLDWTTRLRAFGGLLVLLVFAAACDNTSSLTGTDEFDVTASADAIAQAAAQDLGLSQSGQAGIARSYAQHGDTTQPGFMWRVAADLQANLDDDQKARLIERGSRFTPPQRRQRGAQGDRPRGDRQRFGRIAGAVADSLGLSAEQRDAIKAIYAESRTKAQALMQQRRDGTLEGEAFREALTVLREETQAAVQAVLTPEQLAQLEAMQADRADVRAQLEALHAEHQSEVATILDETQLETVYIHRALTQIVRKHHANRRADRQRPGNRRGQG